MTAGPSLDPDDPFWAEVREELAKGYQNGHADEPEPPPAAGWLEPEDRRRATRSPMGQVAYVDDLIFPGRIVVWAAEEGSGKSYTVLGELAVRLCGAGGAFAGTWEVKRTGPVLALSEMHADDDYEREDTVLASLGTSRAELQHPYYRLPLLTAANGTPPLVSRKWREHITGWIRDHGVIVAIFDTATGATQVDPWGKAIQKVFADLRLMLDANPALCIVCVVHVSKPKGFSGDRGIAAVLGEWGRWADVVVLQENHSGLREAMLTTRKRVKVQRRIIATKAGGLLVAPKAADETPGATTVPLNAVVAVVEAAMPTGTTIAAMALALGVTKPTAQRYVNLLPDRLAVIKQTNPKPTLVRVIPLPEPRTINESLADIQKQQELFDADR